MNKTQRQALIQDIVDSQTIQKQEDLVKALESRGLEITQATISRDMKEMSLVKVPLSSGGYRYSMPEHATSNVYRQLEDLLSQSFVSIDSQDEMILIETTPGSAEALSNVLKSDDFDEIFAVVVNDDSVLIICRSQSDAESLRNELLKFI